MCCWLNQSSFSGLKTALPPLIPSSVNAAISSSRVKDLAIGARRPAEQREEVDHRFGQIALPRVLDHRGRAMTLAQPLLVGSEDQRHVREPRHRRAERLVQQDLLRRVRDVIVAPHHMRDLHLHIVGHDGELIGRMAVGAQEDEVFDVRAVELDRAVHEVVEARRALGHAEADRARHGVALARGDLVRRQCAARAVVAPGADPPASAASRLAFSVSGVQ